MADFGTVRVSTVFLGNDHNSRFTGKPVLWETMIFGGPFDGEQHRYTSKMEALKEHKELVVKLRRSNVEKPEKPKRLLRPIGE